MLRDDTLTMLPVLGVAEEYLSRLRFMALEVYRSVSHYYINIYYSLHS